MARVVLSLLVVALATSFLNAAVPEVINYQGRLMTYAGTPVSNGGHQLTFRLYSEQDGGEAIWSETQYVYTDDGLFNVLLGSVTRLPDVEWGDTTLWIGMTLQWESEMYPRLRLTSVPYAIRASIADIVNPCDTTSLRETIYLLEEITNDIQTAYNSCPPEDLSGCISLRINWWAQGFIYQFGSWISGIMSRRDSVEQEFTASILDTLIGAATNGLDSTEWKIMLAQGDPVEIAKIDNSTRDAGLSFDAAVMTKAKVRLAAALEQQQRTSQLDIIKRINLEALDKLIEDIPGLGVAYKKLMQLLLELIK